jgi:hypothetical protein
LYGNSPRWSYSPLLYQYHKKVLHQEHDPGSVADYSWNISQDEESVSRTAYYLPGQIERVTGSMFTGDIATEMRGGVLEHQCAVRAYLVRDAYLLDGAIYKGSSCRWLSPHKHRLPKFRINNEITRGSSYSTYNGNVYFGMWLLDDCATYRLAERDGTPICTNLPPSKHTLEYEQVLGMKPIRLDNAYFHEVILYDDLYQTRDKRRRCRYNAKRLLSRVTWQHHPGVFILRKNSGLRRKLHNELALAEYFQKRRGFRIVDITTMGVPEIMAACAGARVILGIEGSHLVHGMMVLDPGGSVLTLQPPDRFCSCLKRVADPDSQNFGFVVGIKSGDGFIIDPEEVERTLDLFPDSCQSEQNGWNQDSSA